ncbi:MAG: hypothetical protein HY906_06710 [Deltaproteobacteria bacterium]|nr:hypothetical protein [Deltaproteobacteria bacterium]
MRSTVLVSALVFLISTPVLDPAAARAAPGEPRVRAPAKAARPTLSRRNTIPLSEIKPGMEGYGLTVFEGTKVERFHVRVVGILKKMLPRQDIVLFRSDDPRLKHSGIVRGMSGSPVYLNGRLAGAVAYGWPFSKDPIGGITPIEYMMQVGDRPLRGRDQTPFAQADTEVSRQLLARAFGLGPDGRPTGATPKAAPAAAAPGPGMQRVGIPLNLTGFHPRTVEELRKTFAPFGLEPMQGTGGGEEGVGPAKFENGGSIGVALVRGDMSAVGTGTVTHVEGNTVLAFGHPMFGVGEWYLPVMTARVHTFMPSIAASFKMSSPLVEAGALVMDRQAAIVADMGQRVDMIPIEVTINAGAQPTRVFKAEVARHKFLTPMLAGAVVMSAGMEAAPDLATAVVNVDSMVKIKGYDALHFHDRLFTIDGMSPRILAFSGAFRAMHEILFNPFEKVAIEKLTFKVNIAYGPDAAEMIALRVDSLEVDPGQKVNLYVTLRQYQGSEYVVTVPFEVPKEYAGQNLWVELVPGNFARPPLAMPETLRGILENLRKPPYPSDTFVISLMKPSDGVSYRGRLMPELPPSAIDTMRQTTSLRRVDSFRSVTQIVRPAGRVVVGRQSITFKVKDLP